MVTLRGMCVHLQPTCSQRPTPPPDVEYPLDGEKILHIKGPIRYLLITITSTTSALTMNDCFSTHSQQDKLWGLQPVPGEGPACWFLLQPHLFNLIPHELPDQPAND